MVWIPCLSGEEVTTSRATRGSHSLGTNDPLVLTVTSRLTLPHPGTPGGQSVVTDLMTRPRKFTVTSREG